jgi:hypothetical protein
MKQTDAIRQLFLGQARSYPINEAAHLLGWSVERLAVELSAQYLVPEGTWTSSPVPWRAVAVLAVTEWSYAQIEQALAAEASVLPALVRTKALHLRLPGYQIAVLRFAAHRAQTSVDEFLARYLLDLVCNEAPSLAGELPGFREAFHWPESAALQVDNAQTVASVAF